MNIYVVVAIKDNLIEQHEAFLKREEAVEFAWKLVKDELFFEEWEAEDEPYVPPANPFIHDSHAENTEGCAAIDILTFTV